MKTQKTSRIHISKEPSSQSIRLAVRGIPDHTGFILFVFIVVGVFGNFIAPHDPTGMPNFR